MKSEVVRNILASAISVALLAGCNSDDKRNDSVVPGDNGEIDSPLLRPGNPGQDGNNGTHGGSLDNPMMRPGNPGQDGNNGTHGGSLDNPMMRPGNPGQDGNNGTHGGSLDNPMMRPGSPGEDGNNGTLGDNLDNPLLRPGNPGEDGNNGTHGGDLENPLLRPGRPGEDGNDGTHGGDLENPLLRPGRPGEDGKLGGLPGEKGSDGNLGVKGCVPTTGAIGNQLRLYTDGNNCSDTRFVMTIADDSGKQVVNSLTGTSELANIQTQPVAAWERDAPVRISITQDKPASVMMESEEALDLSTPAFGSDNELDGTIRFFINPLSTPEEGQRVLLSLPTKMGANGDEIASYLNDGQGYAHVDLTSAIHAYRGLDIPQEVKVPTRCFIKKGVDFTDMTTPFHLTSESNFDFELSSISVQGRTASQQHVLECDSDSLLINEPHSKLYEVTFDDDHKTSHTGWARNRKGNQVSRGTTAPEDPFQGQIVTFHNGSTTGTYWLEIPDNNSDKPKDISRFMKNGELQFNLYVTSFGNKTTRDITITMESDHFGEKGGESETFKLTGIEAGKLEKVTIPVNDLMTRHSDGQGHRIDVDLLRNITTGLRMTIDSDSDDEADTLDNVQFIINNVYLSRTGIDH